MTSYLSNEAHLRKHIFKGKTRRRGKKRQQTDKYGQLLSLNVD